MKKLIFLFLTLLVYSCDHIMHTSDYKYIIMHGNVISSYTNYYEIKDGCVYFNDQIVCGSFDVYNNSNYKGNK